MWRLAPADVDPVVLRHSRIYILPTGRGAALMTTLLIMLLTAMNYALSLGYAFVFIVGGLVAAALLATFRNLAGVAVAPVAAGEAFAGGELAFTLSIASNARDRVGLLVTAQDGHAEVIDVPAAATRPASISITARRRGRRDLGRVTLSSDFPLGLWRAWSYVHFPLAGVVYPAPEAGAPPLPLGVRGSDSRRSAEASDAELAGVRDYQTGDPHNRVAWKAVARGAGWYTKQFEGSGGGGALTLDWSELPPPWTPRTVFRAYAPGSSRPSAKRGRSRCASPVRTFPWARAQVTGALRSLRSPCFPTRVRDEAETDSPSAIAAAIALDCRADRVRSAPARHPHSDMDRRVGQRAGACTDIPA